MKTCTIPTESHTTKKPQHNEKLAKNIHLPDISAKLIADTDRSLTDEKSSHGFAIFNDDDQKIIFLNETTKCNTHGSTPSSTRVEIISILTLLNIIIQINNALI